MKTTMIIMFVFWSLFITFLVLILRYEWPWGWIALPVGSIVMSAVIYILVYRENHEKKNYLKKV